jgi:GPH family glycoside/pentoside/hexuronide:cation symporter
MLAVWAALSLMAVNTASTIINIPYSSLTPELTDDYHERTSLNAYRFGCAVFGTLIGAAAVEPIVGLFADKKTGFSMAGLILGSIMLVSTLLTFFGTKEKKHTKADIPTEGFFSTYKAVFTNKPFVILILTYALHMVAITFLTGILVYYTKYIYRREDITTPAMIVLLLVAMVFIPVSVFVSKKIGKKRTYQICFIIIAAACMGIFFLGESLGVNFFLGIMVFAGIGVGFSYVAPFAMVPDTVEYDATRIGERKEGAYYGMWTFISKLGTALSIFMAGLILSKGGYIADAIQGEKAMMAIRIIIGPLPAIIFVIAIVLIQFYPLNEEAYKKLILLNELKRSKD